LPLFAFPFFLLPHFTNEFAHSDNRGLKYIQPQPQCILLGVERDDDDASCIAVDIDHEIHIGQADKQTNKKAFRTYLGKKADRHIGSIPGSGLCQNKELESGYVKVQSLVVQK
jgi:hypothetical protein